MHRPKQRTKFSITPMMDFRSKIADILGRTECEKHKVPTGVPCFHIPKDVGGYHAAICNTRVLGVYNGTIDPTSISNKRPQKEFSR
jgi:hypothetical protein